MPACHPVICSNTPRYSTYQEEEEECLICSEDLTPFFPPDHWSPQMFISNLNSEHWTTLSKYELAEDGVSYTIAAKEEQNDLKHTATRSGNIFQLEWGARCWLNMWRGEANQLLPVSPLSSPLWIEFHAVKRERDRETHVTIGNSICFLLWKL